MPQVLFNPLTGLEVLHMKVDGSVLVVQVGLAVNLTSLTIDRVIGKRKRMLEDMMPGFCQELRQTLKKARAAIVSARASGQHSMNASFTDQPPSRST